MNIDKLLIALIKSVPISAVSMLLIYWGFCITHYGFGGVVAPDWFTEYDEYGFPISFPFTEVIEYWKSEARKYALIGGGSIFTLSLIWNLLVLSSSASESEVETSGY